MDQDSAHMIAASKYENGTIPYSKDYALWEVIINGDSLVPEPAVVGTVVPLKIKAQNLARKNELKAKSTLLLAISDEHLLKFHSIKDAKSLWEAIKIRVVPVETPTNALVVTDEMGYDWSYQAEEGPIDIALMAHSSSGSSSSDTKEDANLKLLRSLPSAWNTHTLIMRNKYDLDTLSMDDLYNNLKVYEAEIKSQSILSLNSHNVAFVFSDNTSSINEAVNTTHDVSGASSQR
nr:hypothetical protein [Tanacetum cinerariifolium]